MILGSMYTSWAGIQTETNTMVVTATAEGAGKLAFGKGFVTQVRPRAYFTIPKASLERLLDDVEQFINFFVIEFQRVVFAENLPITVGVSALLRNGKRG